MDNNGTNNHEWREDVPLPVLQLLPTSQGQPAKKKVSIASRMNERRLWWFLDIMDAGCREFFVIDGDSLLAHFILNPKRHKLVLDEDKVPKTVSSREVSSLQLFWLIERFLLQLNQRNCVFDVVFFKSNSAIWIDNSGSSENQTSTFRFLLLRKMLSRHLQRFLPALPRQRDDTRSKSQVANFPDWQSDEWLRYCNEMGPRFVLVTLGRPETSSVSAAEVWHTKIREIWRGMAAYLMSTGVCSVVKLDGLKFKGNRIEAATANATTFRRAVKLGQEEIDLGLAEIKDVVERLHCVTAEMRGQYEAQQASRDSLKNIRPTHPMCSPNKIIIAASLNTFAAICPVIFEDLKLHFTLLATICHVVGTTLSLQQRNYLQKYNCLVDKARSFKTVNTLLSHFARAIYYTIEEFNDENELVSYPLVFDKLLFMNLLCEMILSKRKKPNQTFRQVFGALCYQEAEELCELAGVANSINDLNVGVLVDNMTSFSSGTIDMKHEEPWKSWQLQNLLFNDILAPVLPQSDEIAVGCDDADDNQLSKFFEEWHWHGEKKLESGAPSSDRRATTNARGRIQSKHRPLSSADVLKPRQNKSTSAKTRPESTSEVYEKSNKEFAELQRDLAKELSLADKLFFIKMKTHAPSKSSVLMTDSYTSIKVHLLELQLIEETIVEQVNAKSYSNVCDLKIQAYNTAKTIFNSLPQNMREDHILKILSGCLKRFGFYSCAKAIASAERSTYADDINNGVPVYDFSFKSALRRCSFLDDLAYHSDAEFQMSYCGKFFDRCTNPQSDSRVDFTPDAWQRQLLDVVDRNESALVCAPTSSGKTFIAFYAMGKALKSTTDELVIYVSPTKAVVNQVADEIKERFPDHLDQVGVYTRDFRLRQFDCRVLVCVPQILEILLLSPVLTQEWIPRLKLIIFDEVHSMGERDGGVVWEHLLLMAPCRILALSASVANYGQIFDWMKDSQERKGFKMHLITSDRRYCDLRKFIYAPKSKNRVFDNENEDTTQCQGWVSSAYRSKDAVGNLVRVNPFAGISSSNLVERGGFASNFKLLPDECIKVYGKLKQACLEMKVDSGKAFKQLKPSLFFKDRAFLTRDDADDYESKLKEIVLEWTKDAVKNEVVSHVVRKMNDRIEKLALGHLDKLVDEHTVFQEFPILLRELASQDLLPAIVFCLDREGCVTLAEAAVSNMVNLRDQSISAFRPRGKERNFTFSDSPKQENILNKATAYLKEHLQDESHEFLIKALKFGIGVHHGGLPARYRLIVEGLFRMKIISVVIATGTLACGINTPCRTVVFATDSIYLDSVNHLQMMGRAGRRGFDLVGHVVYFGLSFQRVKQLLCWPLQPLVANFPVSCSLVLRTLCLETQFRESQPVRIQQGQTTLVSLVQSRIKNLFKSSFYSNGRAVPEMQILQQTRFSIEYFLKTKLINRQGHLVEAAGMVSHLFYTEPSNLVFASLITSGILEKVLLDHPSTQLETKADYFLTIFASLFNRKPVKLDSKAEKPPDAILILPELPECVYEFIIAYNHHVLRSFTACMKDYGERCFSSEDSRLPLSRIDLNRPTINNSSMFTTNSTKHRSNYVRSLFSSLSGNEDCLFSDAYDFTAHIRAGIYLDEVSIPTFDLMNGCQLNAYIVDFSGHGSMARIEKDNQIKSGYVYDWLNDADLLIAAIASSLRRLCEQNQSYKFVSEVATTAANRFRAKMYQYAYMKSPNNLIENDPLKI